MNKMRFNTYSVIHKEHKFKPALIKASNPTKAWGKFSNLFFGNLKPDRKDYAVKLTYTVDV